MAIPRRGPAGAANPVLDFDKVTLGCGEQILALASARDGELGVSADDQALAGIVIGSDAGQITLIEQRELEDPRIDQGTDLRGAQRGDPVEPSWLDILLEACLGDHAAVTDQHDVFEREAFFELLDLAGQGRRIGRTACEDIDRHRTAIRIAQQTVNDLRKAPFAVAIVPELNQSRTMSSIITARNII